MPMEARNAATLMTTACQIPTPNATRTAMTPVTSDQNHPSRASIGPTTGIGNRYQASDGE